ncbi:radical SAM enzyme, Cfr family protein [Pseudomonas putida]|uniref:Radical SAM enzyme, Cfr family protein n=1 Tax=Pseudomonas putida TaxID=303 RepID=A0A8I1EB07_PSEPU|nr:radical SAM enzyme, Cfr family protein [Pseudomonas putida]MBI6883169.1 radical SAM enzyme, Cfr family protein [Pseudomonas putida]
MLTTLKSSIDQSVNFISPADGPGFFESRHVRRDPKPGGKEYVICYLSSQSGCRQACRMCHLTQSGQVDLVDAKLEDFLAQADTFFSYYDENSPAALVHFNFMARGEVLCNPLVLESSELLFRELMERADARSLESKFLVSTIFPRDMGNRSLLDIFPTVHPEIYYSIYSMNRDFRRRWLPKAHAAEHGLDLLKAWQDSTGKVPKIHFAFIKGENDSEADMRAIGDAINSRDLRVNLNIVRYNPHSERVGCESDEDVILRNTSMLADLIGADRVKIVPKVGFDVKASCGMFVDKFAFSGE